MISNFFCLYGAGESFAEERTEMNNQFSKKHEMSELGNPWLASGRCGSQDLLPDGKIGQCDPKGWGVKVKFEGSVKV